MRTIQEVGSEILTGHPKSFYIFGGTEYGIKRKYLSLLTEFYNNSVVELQTISELISIMSTKHLFPLPPSLYICRYDDSFVSSLSEAVARKLHSLNIIGTAVCLYENEKHIDKLDKFLPDYVVRIDDVNTQFKIKYLHSDFKNVPDRLINLCAEYGDNYSDAQNMCAAMSVVSPESLFALNDKQLLALFGKSSSASEDDMKVGIASRNFKHLINVLDNYTDIDTLYYTILSTMIELDKITSNQAANSSLRAYAKRWTKENIYNMFMNTYQMLKQSRMYSIDNKLNMVYLFSLLEFETIPSVDYMEG